MERKNALFRFSPYSEYTSGQLLCKEPGGFPLGDVGCATTSRFCHLHCLLLCPHAAESQVGLHWKLHM